jgi:general secretion pathway protein D
MISAYTPTNSLIIVDSENNIARLVELILGLDVPGQERTVEVIPLTHASATDVAAILREAIEDESAARGGSGGSGGGGPVTCRASAPAAPTSPPAARAASRACASSRTSARTPWS